MKKNIQPARTETKSTKKLFGISEDKLSAVHGGGGAVGNITSPITTTPSSTNG